MKRNNRQSVESVIRELASKASKLGVIDKPLTHESEVKLRNKIIEIEQLCKSKRSEKTIKQLKTILRPDQLESKTDEIVKVIEMEFEKLQRMEKRFGKIDNAIFSKIKGAYTKRDMARVHVFAIELAEIRKMEKKILFSMLALDRVLIGIKLASTFDNIFIQSLAEALIVLYNVKKEMSTVSPDVERDLKQIEIMLSELIDAGQNSGLTLNSKFANRSAQEILDEVGRMTKKKIKEEFLEPFAYFQRDSSNEKSP